MWILKIKCGKFKSILCFPTGRSLETLTLSIRENLLTRGGKTDPKETSFLPSAWNSYPINLLYCVFFKAENSY